MSFEPTKITQTHVIKAAEIIDTKEQSLRSSTKYDVIVNGKSYPPKDLMRLAHEQATGIYQWNKSGGDETNKYLENLGFQIQEKNKANDPILSLISQYKELLRKNWIDNEMYKWELMNQFQGRPNLKAPDFYEELKSIKYANLIYGPAIGAMNQIAKHKPEEYRVCFKQLFDEKESLSTRIENFIFNIQVLFRQIDANEKHSHYHDERTVATLLTFYNPLKYALFKDSFYQRYCKLIGEKPKEVGEKYVHYLELVEDFIDGYIKTDEELLDMIDKMQTSESFNDPNYQILAQDILYCVLDKNARTFTSLIKELDKAIKDDPDHVQFSVCFEIRGKKGTREWAWISDEQGIINNTIAHYEIEYDSKKGGLVFICIHFEDQETKNIFHQTLGMQLPEALKWFTWFSSKSIMFKTPVEFFGEDAVPNLIRTLTEFDLIIGGQIRDIIENMEAETKDKIILKDSHALNTILYGPPGTGKTYHTINKALEILGENSATLSRSTAKEIFNRYVEDGHIVFTTFHQSLGYEDFIEGIKPQLSDVEDKSLSYFIEDGIFKRLCKQAGSKVELRKQSKDVFSKSRYFKMSLGGLHNPEIHDWCIENNCIALGWGEDEDFSDLKNISEWNLYRDEFNKRFPEMVARSRFNIQAMYTFQQMKVGDIVVISKGNRIIDAIGRISGDYEWNDHTPIGFYQFRKVEWLAKNLNELPSRFFKKNISQQSIYEFYETDVKKEVFTAFFQDGEQSDKPFVLIIDEINRGNVSQVFGELITLIEDTKRIGMQEELSVILPYSKEKFGVPSNVFIIGTMNTADRSVEALDTALRRRFSFEEMLPEPDLLTPHRCFLRFHQRYFNITWEDWEKNYYSKAEGFYEFCGMSDIKIASKEDKNLFESLGDNFNIEVLHTELEKLQIQVKPRVDLSKLLAKLNKRIEVLKDRDHQIGHAYFIGLESMEDLMVVFKDKIVPLLQEYFFGDYQKIQLVLGEGFIEHFTSDVDFAVEDDNDYSELPIYKVSTSVFDNVANFKEAMIKLKY